MISVTQRSIELLNANSRTFRMKLVNGSDEYTNILSLKWSAALPTYLSIGNAICTCVECKAVGVPISIKCANLKVYITVMDSNDEWVQIGTFKAEKPTLQNGVVSFSAYDVMNECSKAIFKHKLGKVTIRECYEAVIADIESEIGTVSYVPLPSSVASHKINADLLIGYDCRNVLAYIAGYLGCNCVVNNTGAIEMRGFTVCDYTLNDNRIAEPELDDNVSDLEFLACSVNSDTKLLYGNNGEGFEFICPIMNQERLDQIGATLCAPTSAVNVYRSGKIKHILGDFRLQIGDIISLEHNGETHIIPISSIAFEFDGGLSADIESLPLAEASALSLSDTLDFISKQNANKRIKGITNYYLATSDAEGVTKDRMDWTDAIQKATIDKKYLWNYEIVMLADGTSYETEPCIIGNFAEKGSNGRGIKSITEYYLTTQTESTPSKTSFKPNVQTPTETLPFLWNYEKIEYTDDSKPYESDVRLIGVYGSDGKSFYTWVRYADDANGTNMSDSPSERKYIGIATNKTTETESNVPGDYKWSMIKGTDGKGVSKVETEYYLSTSDQYLSGDSWSTSAPTWVDGRYLWTRLATYYTDSEKPEYSDPVVDASWKKTTAIESASKEFNDSLIKALGFYITETTDKIKYYHSKTPLAECEEGDIILIFNSSGFGVCTTGWNGGNPFFQNGMDFGQGKAIWNILVANKISADLIETGKLKSLSSAKVQTELDLDTGEMTFSVDGYTMRISGASTDANGITKSGGIAFSKKYGSKAFEEKGFCISCEDITFIDFLYEWNMLLWRLNGGQKPEDPYYSKVGKQHIKSKTIHCQDLLIMSRDGSSTEQSLFEVVSTLGTTVLSLQQKIIELENKFGQQHEHIYTSRITVNATCTSNGTRVYECACGESSYEESIPAIGHSDSNGDGYCDVCGAKIGTFYTITVQSNDKSMGTASGGGSYVSGKSITITATPEQGHKFSHWNDGNTNATRTITVTGNATYIAYFEVDTSSGGSGDSDIGSDEVRIITSVGGGSANSEYPPCITDEEGVGLGTDLVVKVNSGVYICAVAADGWIVASVSVYVDGELAGSVSSSNMGDNLLAEYFYFGQPVLTSYAGHTIEYKFYFAKA